jgi:protein phosphatase
MVEYAVLSDVGMRRPNNQDAATALPAKRTEMYRARGHLFVVADGMGAHAAGELASRMAIDKIPHYYLKNTEVGAAEALRQAIEEANYEIHSRGQQNPEFHNMGTTASALALLPDGAIVGHVGDSRVYRLRGQVFEQLTFDHSLVWEMQASGQVPADSALSQTIPKHVITRSLGPSDTVSIDLEGPWPVRRGDRYLLCSDGLTGQVDDTEIGVLLGCLPPHRAVRVLVDLANLRGGNDNITVIAVQVTGDPRAAVGESTPPPRRRKLPPDPLLATTAACILGTLILALLGQWATAAVTAVLSLVAIGFTLYSWLNPRQTRSERAPTPSQRTTSPYRRYPAQADEPLLQRLAGTVQALRDAAVEKGWELHWENVDQLQSRATRAQDNRNLTEAVRLQSEAIIETMQQLRDQHSRQAGESTLDL